MQLLKHYCFILDVPFDIYKNNTTSILEEETYAISTPRWGICYLFGAIYFSANKSAQTAIYTRFFIMHESIRYHTKIYAQNTSKATDIYHCDGN